MVHSVDMVRLSMDPEHVLVDGDILSIKNWVGLYIALKLIQEQRLNDCCF